MELKKLKITDKKIELLTLMGIDSGEGLFAHYPFRYEEIVQKPFNEWQKDDKITCEGIIVSQARVLRFGSNRSMTKFSILIDEEVIDCTIYNRPWTSAFAMEKKITVMGTYQGDHKLVCTNYNFQPISEQIGLHPVYSTREGISQKDWQKLIQKAIDGMLREVEDVIPEDYRQKYHLLHKRDALYFIHKPPSMNHVKQAIRTLKYEEFLMFQLCMQSMRLENSQNRGIEKHFSIDQVMELKRSLAFELTEDQQNAIMDILHDLSSSKSMMRLVQGDVGCGKTMVAAFALYACICAHKQGAFMAPTELLAKQHTANLKRLFADHDVVIELYCSSLKNSEKKDILERLKNNQIDILIGTHALFQEDVSFYDLGLVIADEQHRFGVQQRRALLAKGEKVDFLLMSATPIPRTLASSYYGDLDVSTIAQLPKGRSIITTKVVKSASMKPILNEVLTLIDEGNQAYVVCPSIETNEEMKIKGVEEIYEGMRKTLKGYKIGLIHGRMSTEEKDRIMNDFLAKQIDVLVATTVIEVGVDVKDANIMVIYDAHRFGLSQLHQLRGRVGRGNRPGYCYLLSPSKDETSMARLKILENTSDGFEIAKQDLIMRGPGDILGIRQSGVPGFILGDFVLDSNVLETARQDACELLKAFAQGAYPDLKNLVMKTVDSTKYLD